MSGIVFAGDLHASPAIYTSLPGMQGDSEFALQQITDYARQHDHALVLLGDNFDRRFPDSGTLARVLELLDGSDVAFIQGQHDVQPSISWPDVSPYTVGERVHLNGKLIEWKGIKLYGLDCERSRDKLAEKLKKVPKDCEILCLHQLIKQVMGIEEAWHLDIAQVPEHVKYTVLGDWHGLPQNGETDGRKWAYTGSSTMRSISEPTGKSFLVAQKISDQIGWERVPLLTRPFMLNDVRFETELTTWCDAINAAFQKATKDALGKGVPLQVARPFVALRFNVAIPGAHDKIMAAIGPSIEDGSIHFHPMPHRKFTPDSPDYANVGANVSAQAAIDESIDKVICPELHELVSDLANAPDPRVIAVAFKHRHRVYDSPLTGVSSG